MSKKILLVSTILFIILVLSFDSIFAQQKQTNLIPTVQDTSLQKQKFRLRMDAIEIKGWIEKPQTIFILPGINPEVDDIVLERSFANEILRPIDKVKFEKQKIRKRKTVIPW